MISDQTAKFTFQKSIRYGVTTSTSDHSTDPIPKQITIGCDFTRMILPQICPTKQNQEIGILLCRAGKNSFFGVVGLGENGGNIPAGRLEDWKKLKFRRTDRVLTQLFRNSTQTMSLLVWCNQYRYSWLCYKYRFNLHPIRILCNSPTSGWEDCSGHLLQIFASDRSSFFLSSMGLIGVFFLISIFRDRFLMMFLLLSFFS